MDGLWQRVLTCTDYYDGPLKGIANVEGVPHLYDRQFDSVNDDYSDLFTLTKTEPDLLALLLEDWQIWLGWDAAFQEGQVSLDTHPALPAVQARHEELDHLIKEAMSQNTSESFVKRGVFKIEGGKWHVRWSAAPSVT